MTTLFLFVRLAQRLLALPGRVLVRWIDGRKAVNGVPPLGTFLRGCVHGFVWLIALMAFSMATAPAPTPTATPAMHPAPRYDPPPLPASYAPPTPSFEPVPTTPPSEVEDVPHVPPPDDDDDWDKPRICHRKWWC